MRLLILSDVHSNYEALRGVLDDGGGFDEAICVGDTVGYGPYPGECIRLVSGLPLKPVAGNHDDAVARQDSDWFNSEARRAIAINRRLLNESELAWLRALPLELQLEIEGLPGPYSLRKISPSPHLS